MVSYLLEKGADPNEGSQSGSNPLETACLNGDKDIAKLLILHGATVKTSRALMEASENGDVELLQLLLDNGADINGRPDYEKLSPMFADDEGWGSALHCALKAYRVENVKFLLDQGAALNVKNPKGCTPLDLANKSGFEDIVKLFG